MRIRRRQRDAPVREEVVDPLPAFEAAAARMPVQCLMYDDQGTLCVFAAVPLDDDELVELDLVMSELPLHPPVTPASWLDQYLDRWHHGRFAGWRVRGEHTANGHHAVVHPDFGLRPLRAVHPSAGVHVIGPYIRYGTGSSTGARHVRVDHDQRCAEILFHRTVEAGAPLTAMAQLEPHPTCRGVAAPPLPPRPEAQPEQVTRSRRGPSLRTIPEPGGIVSGIDPA